MQFDPTVTIDGLIYGLAILILIGVTIYYAIQNKRMADELKRQNENAMRPYLLVTGASINIQLLDSRKCILPEISLQLLNAGNGAALDIRIEADAEFEILDNEGGPSLWIYKFQLSTSAGQKRYTLAGNDDAYRLTHLGCEQAKLGNAKGTIFNITCFDVSGKEIRFIPQNFESLRHSGRRKEGILWPHDAEYASRMRSQ